MIKKLSNGIAFFVAVGEKLNKSYRKYRSYAKWKGGKTMNFEELCLKNEVLSKHSSYQIGGVARYFAMPTHSDELLYLLTCCKEKGLRYFFCGMGSNILFPDSPDPNTLYISLKKMAYWDLTEDKWYISAGMPMSMLALAGLTADTSEFDFTYLLPGALGSGIYMNAKYLGGQISDIVKTIYYVNLEDETFVVKTIDVASCGYGYKQSIFQQNPWLILGADLKTLSPIKQANVLNGMLERWKNEDGASHLPSFYSFMSREILALVAQGKIMPSAMQQIDDYRNDKRHFTHPSCGSVFKNNYDFGTPVGALVDQLGYKGVKRGGAIISPYHGNMILNLGDATSNDIKYLIKLIQEGVNERFGFIPEPEVVIVP
jgi:UDP-N-acetylmuramate dehydrogenase